MMATRSERLLCLLVGVAVGTWLGGGVRTQLDAIALLALCILAVVILVTPSRPPLLTRRQQRRLAEEWQAAEALLEDGRGDDG